jgi:thiol:disulfide interchange protein DsbD
MRILTVILLWFSLFAHAGDADLLEAEQAFRFSARSVDAGMLEVRYQIAEGYYLYRDKFKFSVEPAADFTLGTPQIPPGKVKQDEYFGKVETYRHEVVVKIPYTRSGSATALTLKATSQGCADIGVCYPPQTQTAKLTLPVAKSADESPSSPASTMLAAMRQLGSGLVGSASEFLPVEQAFPVFVRVKDSHTLLVDFEIAEGHYLYRDKLKFTLKNGGQAAIEQVELPPGEIKHDPNFGRTEVYHKPVQAVVTISNGEEKARQVALTVAFQGCSEKGICYPPQSKTFNLSLPAAPPVAKAAPAAEPAAPVPDSKPSAQPQPKAEKSPTPPAPAVAPAGDESSRIAALFKGGSFWLVIASFFGFGLLLALTPCVFPMIPILSGIIVGHGQHLTKGRTFALSLAYVLGMAITYALAGIAAGLSGAMISSALQNPWALGGFALIFVLLAFSMFGFYELQMPNFIQSWFNKEANQIKGGSLTGVFAMGALSAVIVGPCVAAPLAGALLYIGQTRDVVLGGSALFALALGMGLPLLLVGMSAGTLLPKAGGWMNAVKNFFGVLMLGMAIWLISPVISPALHMLAWAALLIVSAIYLHALDPLPPPPSGFKKFWKGVGVIALIAGIALLVGVLSGSRDILQPLGGLRAVGETKAAAAAHLQFEKVKSRAELDARIQAAAGKIVMLDFYADWCVSCEELERFTFADPQVIDKLKDTVLLQADVTANSEDDKALLQQFNLFGPPGVIFFGRDGKEIGRVIGYEEPEKFLTSLENILR